MEKNAKRPVGPGALRQLAVKVAMPLVEADLTDQQALDIAALASSQKRRHFELSEHLSVTEKLGEDNASTAK